MPKALCGFNDGPGVVGRDLLIQGGPTIVAFIGFDPNYDLAKPDILPKIPQTHQQALIDTGATDCCIDSALALALNLPIVDQRVCSGIGGQKVVNMHLAQIFVPTVAFTFTGAFAGVDLVAGGQSHTALIGRTFLQFFTLTYYGLTGTVELDGPTL